MTDTEETTWEQQDDWLDPEGDYNPPQNGDKTHTSRDNTPPRNYSSLFDAPDLTDFVKEPKTAVAREYEQRTRALLKALMSNSLAKENYADAATYLYYGPGISSATGYLASADERAKKMVDFFTSPGNPYVMFALAAAPMIAQLFRNHEDELGKIPGSVKQGRAERKAAKAARRTNPDMQAQVRIKIPFLRKEIPIRVNFRRVLPNALTGFRAQTTDPGTLVNRVFSDPKLIKELRKQGIFVGHADE